VIAANEPHYYCKAAPDGQRCRCHNCPAFQHHERAEFQEQREQQARDREQEEYAAAAPKHAAGSDDTKRRSIPDADGDYRYHWASLTDLADDLGKSAVNAANADQIRSSLDNPGPEQSLAQRVHRPQVHRGSF
jgi:hypothetical protein